VISHTYSLTNHVLFCDVFLISIRCQVTFTYLTDGGAKKTGI